MARKKSAPKRKLTDAEYLRSKYEQGSSTYLAVLQEVKFILENKLSEASIKTHNVEARLKDFDSVLKKSLSREPQLSLDQMVDIVGARVICLFRSDIDRVEKIIRENFKVLSKDDKISASADSFGYMSVHYECEIPDEYSGPRYDKIRNIKFEIQVRTLCMHAWAAVSHYLDYKGEWDVPAHLRKGLNALSALFYVADNEFEQVYAASAASREKAEVAVQSKKAPQEINLDTVTAYLSERFPTRVLGKEAISDFVQELKGAGYASLSEIASDLDRASDALVEYEKGRGLKPGFFAAVGAARASLSIASEVFRKARKIRSGIAPHYTEFERYLKKPMSK